MDLADLAATMDTLSPGGRFAIVAPGSLAFGLGRMYEAFRETHPRSTKQVAVFRSLSEAWAWLDISQDKQPSG
jgi:hypothetical protein